MTPFAEGNDLSTIIQNDLRRSGRFASSASLPQTVYRSADLDPGLWQQAQIPYAVVGRVTPQGDDLLILRTQGEVNAEQARLLVQLDRDQARRLGYSLILIDGQQLAEYLYEYGVGVQIEQATAARDGDRQIPEVGQSQHAGDVILARPQRDDAGGVRQPQGAAKRPGADLLDAGHRGGRQRRPQSCGSPRRTCHARAHLNGVRSRQGQGRGLNPLCLATPLNC